MSLNLKRVEDSMRDSFNKVAPIAVVAAIVAAAVIVVAGGDYVDKFNTIANVADILTPHIGPIDDPHIGLMDDPHIVLPQLTT